ncbi:hypothetical protein FSPOR_565 [Fusarium sporotrichioides]|uniref:Uncharacterized protein n=1 Tax=Fusarium sporotrichioides TaxID=5514 RepID=A0A395SUB5_FUSSP|nr:hypothetical protein FSPOR_565 [Fusarium sporotrichioides]
MSDQRKVEVVVHERARRPALKTAIKWWDYLREYIKQDGNDFPEEFPWSEGFAAEKAEEDQGRVITALQERYDASGSLDVLPKDPKHSSREEVHVGYADIGYVSGFDHRITKSAETRPRPYPLSGCTIADEDPVIVLPSIEKWYRLGVEFGTSMATGFLL